MLIPAIDLMGGQVVQLEQGERLAFATSDFNTWVDRFSSYALVQLIDLDAALGRGTNEAIVRDLCGRLPCQVGGGIRTPARARALIDSGARRVIAGSALFNERGADVEAAARFAEAVGIDRLVAAVDSRGGRVVTSGWKKTLEISPAAAVRSLEAFAGGFLYTHVDGEGMLGGIDMDAVVTVARCTSRRVIAAGGIRSQEEIDELDRLGIDAVAGMAIYKGWIT